MYKEKKHLCFVGLLKNKYLLLRPMIVFLYKFALLLLTLYRSVVKNTLKTAYHRFPGLRGLEIQLRSLPQA